MHQVSAERPVQAFMLASKLFRLHTQSFAASPLPSGSDQDMLNVTVSPGPADRGSAETVVMVGMVFSPNVPLVEGVILEHVPQAASHT